MSDFDFSSICIVVVRTHTLGVTYRAASCHNYITFTFQNAMTTEAWDYDDANDDDPIDSFIIPMPRTTIEFREVTTLTGVNGVGVLTLTYFSTTAVTTSSYSVVGQQPSSTLSYRSKGKVSQLVQFDDVLFVHIPTFSN